MSGAIANKASKDQAPARAEARPRTSPRGPGPSSAAEGILALQAAAGNGAVSKTLRAGESPVPQAVQSVLDGGGQPLEPSIRAWMESRFGEDFSAVRVHTDLRAGESARAIDAVAYTLGNQVVFAPDQYAPATPEGEQMLAHELAHVLQQRGQATAAASGVGSAGSHVEREADEVAAAVAAGLPARVTQSDPSRRVRRVRSLIRQPGPPPPKTTLTDDQLLEFLERFPPGQPITLYHVDKTGGLVQKVQKSGANFGMLPGEFWLTTNVETRTEFAGGKGLDNVLAFKVDRRFIAMLKELSQSPRAAGTAERGMKAFFNVDLAVPRAHFEGGGKGKRLPEGDVNFGLRITKVSKEMSRLFQLSVQQLDHLSYDETQPPGKRLVPVAQYGTLQKPGPNRPPKNDTEKKDDFDRRLDEEEDFHQRSANKDRKAQRRDLRQKAIREEREEMGEDDDEHEPRQRKEKGSRRPRGRRPVQAKLNPNEEAEYISDMQRADKELHYREETPRIKRKLRRMTKEAESKPNMRNVRNHQRDLKRFERLARRTDIASIQQSKLRGDFDEAAQTSRRAGVEKQVRFVRGIKTEDKPTKTPGGRPYPERRTFKPGESDFFQPDSREQRITKSGKVFTAEVNRKADRIDTMKPSVARETAKRYLIQAYKNFANEPGNEGPITIRFAQTPSPENRKIILDKLHYKDSPVGDIYFGTEKIENPHGRTVHPKLPDKERKKYLAEGRGRKGKGGRKGGKNKDDKKKQAKQDTKTTKGQKGKQAQPDNKKTRKARSADDKKQEKAAAKPAAEGEDKQKENKQKKETQRRQSSKTNSAKKAAQDRQDKQEATGQKQQRAQKEKKETKSAKSQKQTKPKDPSSGAATTTPAEKPPSNRKRAAAADRKASAAKPADKPATSETSSPAPAADGEKKKERRRAAPRRNTPQPEKKKADATVGVHSQEQSKEEEPQSKTEEPPKKPRGRQQAGAARKPARQRSSSPESSKPAPQAAPQAQQTPAKPKQQRNQSLKSTKKTAGPKTLPPPAPSTAMQPPAPAKGQQGPTQAKGQQSPTQSKGSQSAPPPRRAQRTAAPSATPPPAPTTQAPPQHQPPTPQHQPPPPSHSQPPQSQHQPPPSPQQQSQHQPPHPQQQSQHPSPPSRSSSKTSGSMTFNRKPPSSDDSDKGFSTSHETSRKTLAGPGKFGVSGSLDAEKSQEFGNGLKTGQSIGFGGSVVVDVEEVEDASPPQYRVTLTINLQGKAGVNASKDHGGVSGSVSLGGSAGLTASFSHVFSAEKTREYLGAVQSGSGGAYREMKVIQLVAAGSYDDAKSYLAQLKGGMGSAAAVQQMAEGDVVELTAESQVEGSIGATGKGAGIKLGASHGGKVSKSLAYVDGKAVITVSVIDESGTMVGGGIQEGAAGGSYSQEKGKSKTFAVSFTLDPSAGDYQSRFSKLMAISTADELRALAAQWHDVVGATTTGHGRSSNEKTTASLGPGSIGLVEETHYSEEHTQDAQGRTTHKYASGGTGGGVLSVGDKEIYKSTVKESFSAEVGPDNKAKGEVSAARSETDIGRSVGKLTESLEKNPIGTVASIVTGNAKLLQERTDVSGKKLNDDSYAAVADLADNPRDWEKAWSGNTDTLLAWRKAGAKIRAAGGDRNKIAKAIAEFEEGTGRSATLENATKGTGASFEFPDEIADQKAVYDKLVAGDPLTSVREMAEQGKKDEALASLNASRDKLTKLMAAVQGQEKKFENPAKMAEMLRRISGRQAELRAELRKLSPPAVAKTAPLPPNFIGPPTAEQADAAKEEEAAKHADNSARINEVVNICKINRNKEAGVFAEVDAEYAKQDSWFSKPDFVVIANKLNSLKPMYEEWQQSVNELRNLYQASGESPDQAAQHGPNKSRWQSLYNKGFKNY